MLLEEEVKEAYELNTGKVIVETFNKRGIDPMAVPGCVVQNHGHFSWGKDAAQSVSMQLSWRRLQKWTLKPFLSTPKAQCHNMFWISTISENMVQTPIMDRNRNNNKNIIQ